jgi:hypothetical protein
LLSPVDRDLCSPGHDLGVRSRAPTQDHERLVTRHVRTLRRIFGPAYWTLVSDISLTVV